MNIAPPLSGNPTATQSTAKASQPPVSKAPPPLLDDSKMRPIALPGAEEIAARNQKPTSPSNFEAINAETKTSSPEDKKSSIEEASKEKLNAPAAANIDHLSAPASRLQSGTATPAQSEEPSSEAPKTAEKHRGSDVVEAPSEEIKKIESETSLKEEEGEDGDELAATKGVEGLKVADETAKPQEEGAKEAEDATKTVED